jgi:hypothetical protein
MTIENYFISKLVAIASLKYQQKYGVSATPSQYILSTDLLNDAFECIDKLNLKKIDNSIFTLCPQSLEHLVINHLNRIEKLLNSTEGKNLDLLSWEDLSKNSTWISICREAKLALCAFDFDLHEWELINSAD